MPKSVDNLVHQPSNVVIDMRFLLSRGLELFAMENDNLRTLAIVLS